jgi:hypothetical protein
MSNQMIKKRFDFQAQGTVTAGFSIWPLSLFSPSSSRHGANGQSGSYWQWFGWVDRSLSPRTVIGSGGRVRGACL